MKVLLTTTLTTLAIALITVVPAKPAQAAGGWYWDCDSESITSFWEEPIVGNELRGRATLCRTSEGMWSLMKVRGLTPGNAYTVWWVYIDDPKSCANFPLPTPDPIPFPEPEGFATPCGLADFLTPDPSGEFLNPLAVFGRMDSLVAENQLRTRFTGDFSSFEPSPGSQVWMLVVGHGPADMSDKRQLARQLLTPEDPVSGTPHVGIEGRPYGYPAAVAVFKID